MPHDLIFTLEVDVTDRDVRPWRIRTHHVRVAVPDDPGPTGFGWSRPEQEARNLAAWMCWHSRGNMVTAVRIIDVEA